MAIPNPKIEIGFDLTDSPIAPFFVLDDDERGRLDNEEYRLGGTIFFDVTDRVRNVSVRRGRPNQFAFNPTAQANIEFNNHDRAFDPLYADSPFFGNIVPRREVRITSNEERVFTGWIDDWDLSYTPDGDSTVTAVALDAFYILSGQTLNAFTPPAETADARINRILDRPGVNWASSLRDIEASTQRLGSYEISADTNALNYLQRVADSEPGSIFVNKDGDIAFTNRIRVARSTDLVTLGEEGISFDNLRVIYGSENLYNEIVVTRQDGGTAIASDINSQATYGVRTFDVTNLLVETDQQIADIAVNYALRFSQPEYRIESLEIDLHKFTEAQQNEILGLELGSVVETKFTPNGIPPTITRYLEIINIEHQVRVDSHYVTFGFSELLFTPFVLDDPVFGKLDDGRLAEGESAQILALKLDDPTFGKLGIGTLG